MTPHPLVKFCANTQFATNIATTRVDETRALPLSYGPVVYGATGTRTRNLVLKWHVVSPAFVAHLSSPAEATVQGGDKGGETVEHGFSTAGVITLHFAR